MYRFSRIQIDARQWERVLEQFPDSTIYQTPEFIQFISDTQNAEPVYAVLENDEGECGYFVGLIVQRFGLRILGSPLPGWTTAYMGLNLVKQAPRTEVVRSLERFAFDELGCVHVEFMDRFASVEEFRELGYRHQQFHSYEIDLRQSEETLLNNMKKSCRAAIRKAERQGLVIEPAHDGGFADEYFSQLTETFARRSLSPTYSKERVSALIRNLAPSKRLLLLRVRSAEGVCIATGIWAGYQRSAIAWGGASRRSYSALRPNELLEWYAIRYWKALGFEGYDLGGGGAYKKKFGPTAIVVPWFRKSRHSQFDWLRSLAKSAYRLRQRVQAVLPAAAAVMANGLQVLRLSMEAG